MVSGLQALVWMPVGLPQNFTKNDDLLDDHKGPLKAVPLTNMKPRTQRAEMVIPRTQRELLSVL